MSLHSFPTRRSSDLVMAMTAAWELDASSVSLVYSPLTANEVVSTCICSALTPKIRRARLAIPANNFVRSCSYNQSSVRPKQRSEEHTSELQSLRHLVCLYTLSLHDALPIW